MAFFIIYTYCNLTGKRVILIIKFIIVFQIHFFLYFKLSIRAINIIMIAKSHAYLFVSLSIIFSTVILFPGCSTTEEFSGYGYDPEGVTNTVDKEIQLQHKRTIGIAEDSVWVSNEFSGARMNDFYKVGNALYRIVIEPERHPINNSPWYAFKVWSNTPKTIHLQLTYKHGDHRYRPRLSKDREHWYPIDADNINTDTSGRATLTLDLDEEPLWVSAQELITSKNMQQWADSIAN